VPVGRLQRKDDAYEFVYTRGAQTVPEFRPFGPMQDLHAVYRSDELFPLFANRIVAKNRPEYPEYLQWLGLTSANHDALEELSRTGGVRATDSLEIFPCPTPTQDETYRVHFFARGLRYLNPENLVRASILNAGERLFLTQDIQNESDRMALLLRTGVPYTLVGFVPRYFSSEFTKLIDADGADGVRVTVQRVNPTAPIQYRLLCTLTAPWPTDFVPCAEDVFQPLAAATPRAH
jgi:hypothetical protein